MILLLLVVATTTFGSKKASAMILVPNPNPPGMPAALEWALATCDSAVPVRSPGFVQWVAPAGAPTTTSVTVPYGSTAPITLEYDWSAAVCSTRNAVNLSNLKIYAASASTGSVSGIIGANLFLDFTPNTTTLGAYRHAGTAFTYTPPSAITTSMDVVITLDTRSVNRFTSGTIGCINPASPPPANFIDNCAPDRPSFLIHIDVNNPPPHSLITSQASNCNIIEGWAYDTNNVFSQLSVELRADDGFKLIPDAVTIANLPNPPPGPPSNVGPLHGFKFDITPFANSSSRSFHIAVRGVDSSGNKDGIDDFGSVITIDFSRCTEPACSILTTSPTAPEPGQDFTATIGFNWLGTNQSYAITPGTLPGGVSYVPPAPVAKTGNTITSQTMQYKAVAANAGSYTLRWHIRVGAMEHDCSGVVTVVAKPYVKIYGNDVAAGGNFAAPGCPPIDPSANILAYSKVTDSWETQSGRPEQWSGSSSQFATYSLGLTNGLFSAGQHSPRTYNPGMTKTTPVNHLAFGNYDPNNLTSSISGTTSPTASQILDPTKVPQDGGKSGLYRCVPDYYSKHPTTNTVGPSHDLNTHTDGSYFYNNNITIGAANNFNGHQAIYVNGNVVINGDITFKDGYNNIGDIPSLWIIASGNISIAGSVGNIAGVFVAQPRPGFGGPTDGSIVTCTASNGGRYTGNALYDSCRDKKLVIDGAFIAHDVKLLRTFGTLSASTQNELADSNQAGEVFKTGAGLYLSIMPDSLLRSSSCVNSNCGYDSITSLPPTL